MAYGNFNDWIWRSTINNLKYDLSFLATNEHWLKINKYKKAKKICSTQLSIDKFSKNAFMQYECYLDQIEQSLKELNIKYTLQKIEKHPKKYSGQPYGTYTLLCNVPSRSTLDFLEDLSDKKFIEKVKTLPIFADIISFISSFAMCTEIDEKSHGNSYIRFASCCIKISSETDNEGLAYIEGVTFDFKKHGYDTISEEKLYSLVLACIYFLNNKYGESLIWDLDFDNCMIGNISAVNAKIKHKAPKPTESALKQW